MRFTQHIVIHAVDAEALIDLVREWQAGDTAKEPGNLGGRLLAFRDQPDRYVLQAEFASYEDAEMNNDRPETQAWAARLQSLITGEPKYENLDVLADF